MLQPQRFAHEVDPGPVQIQARNVAFETADKPMSWIPGHPVASHVVNLLNILLPAGERWFIETFNEALPLIKPKQALVLGISVDSAWCHQAFREARKLHFDLLSDYEPKGEVSRAYGAYDAQAGCSKRALFVIDADGKIAWSYLSPVAINPGVDGVLDALDRL